MNCTQCGAPLNDGAKFCTSCGAATVAPAAPAYQQPQQQYQQANNQQAYQQQWQQPQQQYAGAGIVPGQKEAKISMILGIVAIVFLFILPIVSLVLAIIGLVYANKSKKLGYVGGMLTAGKVINTILIVVPIIILIVTFIAGIGIGLMSVM